MEVRPDKVTILAQSAELATDIDLSRAQESARRAEAMLQANKDDVDYQRAELALRRAKNRINVYEGNV
nr:ATP synthase delta/epsilon chain alpha-helix domain-containing protein [Planococcus glaciei]